MGLPFDSRAVTDELFTVHTCTGHKPPKTAYVAIKHRGYWYYIDDRDQASKSTLALVLQVSRLDFGRQQPAAALPDLAAWALSPRSKADADTELVTRFIPPLCGPNATIAPTSMFGW